jgi:hypothetical protein
MFTKTKDEVQPMTIEAASDYAREIVQLEARGPGDTEGALYRLQQKYGISINQLMHLRAGRAKSCDISLFARLRLAYLDLCRSKALTLLHKIEIEEAKGDDSNQDIGGELKTLVAKIDGQRRALQ